MITNDDIRNIRKRKTATLIKWFETLNRWKWPKEIPDEEPPTNSGPVRPVPRRAGLMEEIQKELGMRLIRDHWRSPKNT